MDSNKIESKVNVEIYTANSNELYELTDREMEALNVVFPKSKILKEYDGLIPSQVNDVVTMLAPVFWDVYIFENKREVDPVAVGIIPNRVFPTHVIKDGRKTLCDSYHSILVENAKGIIDGGFAKKSDFEPSTSYTQRNFLLAQWGRESLLTISDLIKIAKSRWLISTKKELLNTKMEAEKQLALLDITAEEKFGGDA